MPHRIWLFIVTALLTFSFSADVRAEATPKEITDAMWLICDVVQGRTAFGSDPVLTQRAVEAFHMILIALKDNRNLFVGSGFAFTASSKLRLMADAISKSVLARKLFVSTAAPLLSQGNVVAGLRGGLYTILFIEILLYLKLSYDLGNEFEKWDYELRRMSALSNENADKALAGTYRAKAEMESEIVHSVHQLTMDCLLDRGRENRPACQWRALQDSVVRAELRALDTKQGEAQKYYSDRELCAGDTGSWSWLLVQRIEAGFFDVNDFDGGEGWEGEFDQADMSGGGDFGSPSDYPQAPSGPSTPSSPSAPSNPVTPSSPVAPSSPSSPTDTYAPPSLALPSSPIAPTSPLAPASPIAPTQIMGPAGPLGT